MVPEMSPRFAAEYSQVSTQLFGTFVRRKPFLLLKQMMRTQYIYFIDGWRSLPLLLKDRSNPGIHLVSWLPFGEGLLFVSGLCAVLLLQAYLATYWLLLRVLGSGLSRFRRGTRARGSRLSLALWLPEQERLALAVILGVLVTSGAFTMVCCENGRYFLQVTPYLIPLLASFLDAVVLEPVVLGEAAR